MDSSVTLTITLSRWELLRLIPGAWLSAVRNAGWPPWHPRVLWLLVGSLLLVAFSRRSW